MDQLIAFAQEQWIVVVIAVILILIIMKVIKSVIKWLIILGLAAAVIIYGTQYTPDEIKDNIMEVGSKIVEFTKENAVKALLSDSSPVTYESAEGGRFVITAGSFTLEGLEGSSEATLSYLGQSITVELNDELKQYIENAKSS